MRLNQIAAYSGQRGCNQECTVLFAQFGNEKRFFVMAITSRTQCQRGPHVPFAPITISSTVE
jgi:hypothetical protein